jgi:NAD(P)-dependent dehydrogenase (short-subunit alcohol dehydrogenase family)
MRISIVAALMMLPMPGQAAAPAVMETPVKAVLVTGASTGIGRNVTEHLAAAGYFVYAGARKDADLAALGKIPNVQAIRLDVTKQADVDAAMLAITKAGRGLYGLVNNAGVATPGPASDMSMAEFDLTMQVNLYGPFRMAQAFRPLLSESRGRITNIGSISGILASARLNAYSISKHGIEAFTDSLAAELAPQGVIVNVVEPGNFNSAIGTSATQRTGVTTTFTDRTKYKEPDEVSAAIMLALFEEKPKRRYMVTPDQNEAEYTIRKQIEQLAQLNEDQPYSYSREDLVKMLDEALAKTRKGERR